MSRELDRNKDAVRAHFAALANGDYTVLDKIHDSQGRNHAPAPWDFSEWPAQGKPFGPAEVRETFDWLRTGMPDLEVEVEDLVAEGDETVAWVRMTGTLTRPGGPMAPTRRRTDVRHAHRFRFRDGRIIEHWAIREDLRAMVQAGVVSPHGPPQVSS